MTHVTELASGQITAAETITVELIQADETQPSSSSEWPSKPSVIHPHRFPDVAATIARLFATAVTQLAHIKRERRPSGPVLQRRTPITIAQPFPASPLPAERRCAILTDDSPNLGLP
jgi:hypothetical protein